MIKSGEIVQIKDSAYDGLTGLTIYGNTRQNLWQNPSGTVGGITVTSNSDGSMTLSGSHDSTVVIEVNTHILKPNTAYVLSGDKKPPTGTYFCVGNPVGAAYKTGFGAFTTGSDVDGCVFAFVMQAAIAGGVEMSGTYRVMLREATDEEVQALSQMPVTIPEGGTEDIPQDHPMLLASGDDDFDWCPPGLNSVGDGGSVEVVTAGKNLIEASDKIGHKPGYFINLSGLSLLPGEYTLSFDLANHPDTLPKAYNLYVKYIDEELVTVSTTAPYVNGRNAYTFSVGERVIDLWAYGTDGDIFNIQLEAGNTATPYKPPRTKQTAIDLQGHKLCSLPDGTRDELHVDGDGRVTLIKRVQDIHLDGSTTWYMFTNPFVGYSAYWRNFGGDATGEDYTMLCDKLIVGSKYANSIYSADLNGVAPYLREPSFATDADGVKTWMGSNTPNVVVSLANPKVIELGTIDLPKLRKLVVNTVYVSDDTPATIDVEYNRYRSGCDGFKVGGKHNYWDMHACLASRDTGVPEKKLSTVTVPYMSGFYDLSKLYGAIAFESREVTYTMEFVEDTTEELQARKSAILQWLSMVHDADIFDDDFPGYHFHGSYSDASWEEDDSGLQGSLEVTFLCHPFLVADGETSVSLSAGENTVTVEGQPVNAYAVCASGSATVKFRGVQQSVGTTPVRLSAQLQPGDNAVTVTGSAVTLTWNEERV